MNQSGKGAGRLSRYRRNRHLSLRLGAVAGVVLTAACSLIQDRTGNYVDERRGPGLRLPPWYSTEALGDAYPIPRAEQQQNLSRKFMVPPPPELDSGVIEQNYSLEHSGDQIWLLIYEEPGRVWPALNRFWESQGLAVQDSLPRNGLLRTVVAGNTARSRALLSSLGLSPDDQYHFLVKLDRGLRRRSSEVSVRLVEGPPQRNALEAQWSQLTAQASVEEPLLARIRTFMEEDEANRSYSLLAQDIAGASKVSLRLDQEEPHIRLAIPFDRAWNAVGRALNEAEVAVVDMNRSQGVYLVNFEAEPRAKSGLFSWFGNSREETLSDRYNFQILLEATDDAVRVRAEQVRGRTDTDAAREAEVRLLSRILDHLS